LSGLTGDYRKEEWKDVQEKLKTFSQKGMDDAVKIKKFELIRKIVEK